MLDPDNNLKVYYGNCCSSRPKLDLLRGLASDEKLNFTEITETWMVIDTNHLSTEFLTDSTSYWMWIGNIKEGEEMSCSLEKTLSIIYISVY